MSTTIEPTTLLQVDASVIVGIFIFLIILEYTTYNPKPNPVRITNTKRERFRFPAITIILFSASACSILVGFPPLAYILTVAGFVFIIGAFAYWLKRPDKIPY
jgi:uncharacterized integral membrane protein